MKKAFLPLIFLLTALLSKAKSPDVPLLIIANRVLDETTIDKAKEICDYYHIKTDSIAGNSAYFSHHDRNMTIIPDSINGRGLTVNIQGYNNEKEIKHLLSECGYQKSDKKDKTIVFTNHRKRCRRTKDGKIILITFDKTPLKAFK